MLALKKVSKKTPKLLAPVGVSSDVLCAKKSEKLSESPSQRQKCGNFA